MLKWKSRRISWIIMGIVYLLAACKTKEPINEPISTFVVDMSITNGSQAKLLREEHLGTSTAVQTNLGGYRIVLDGSLLQEIDGFGAALTESSAYLFQEKLEGAQQNAVLHQLFNPENGIGISYLRITMGASDFALSDYTYNDLPEGSTDSDLSKFSIARDKEYVIPVLKKILAISPHLKIMASPWSAPAWMKTNGKLAGGKLKKEWYSAYANYFVKYLKSYQEEGINIHSISVQNEPLHEASYPSMRMDASEQGDFIKNYLGPLLEQEKLGVKILVYDHNWDKPEYPLELLNDPAVKKYIAGSAFHAYAGDVSAMGAVKETHPDKDVYFTEISGGEWAKDFGSNLVWNMRNIFIGSTRNWSKNALLWNLALDTSFGPRNGGCQDCRGVVTIGNVQNVTYNVEYYAIAHFSKFVKPGAKRISTEAFAASSGIDQVAFLNPDGSKVVIVLNSNTESRLIILESGNSQITHSQEGLSVVTYRVK